MVSKIPDAEKRKLYWEYVMKKSPSVQAGNYHMKDNEF